MSIYATCYKRAIEYIKDVLFTSYAASERSYNGQSTVFHQENVHVILG